MENQTEILNEVDRIAEALSPLESFLSDPRRPDIKDDPRVAAALRAVSLLKAAQENHAVRETDYYARGPYAIRRVLDTEVPSEIRSLFPKSNPEHLLIMTWTATVKPDDHLKVVADEVSWVNTSMLSLLERMSREQCSEPDCSLAANCAKRSREKDLQSCSLEDFYRQYLGERRCPSGLALEQFLTGLSCLEDKAVTDEFYKALRNAPNTALTKQSLHNRRGLSNRKKTDRGHVRGSICSPRTGYVQFQA